MTPEEIRAKSLELAAFYTAKANGKTLQLNCQHFGWANVMENEGPDMNSDLSRWRVKPEPRRMWRVGNTVWETNSKETAYEWHHKGLPVTEWMEVLP